MAKAPRDPNAPKRTRSAKPRRVFLMYKGELTEHRCVGSSDEALDIKESDPSWQFMRLTVPVNRKPKAEPQAA